MSSLASRRENLLAIVYFYNIDLIYISKKRTTRSQHGTGIYCRVVSSDLIFYSRASRRADPGRE